MYIQIDKMDVGVLLGLCQQLTWLCKISAQDADRLDVEGSVVVEADLWRARLKILWSFDEKCKTTRVQMVEGTLGESI